MSNMLFMALGCDHLPQAFVSVFQLISSSLQINSSLLSGLDPVTPTRSKPLSVQEKPLLVVVSSDLRQHPVGRFWLPIAAS